MKIKAILCALALTVGSAFGQGLVTFQNSAINAPIRTVTGGVTNNMPAGGAYLLVLLHLWGVFWKSKFHECDLF
jgi:hypothetical protein